MDETESCARNILSITFSRKLRFNVIIIQLMYSRFFLIIATETLNSLLTILNTYILRYDYTAAAMPEKPAYFYYRCCYHFVGYLTHEYSILLQT